MNGVARPPCGLKLTYVKATPLRSALEAPPPPFGAPGGPRAQGPKVPGPKVPGPKVPGPKVPGPKVGGAMVGGAGAMVGGAMVGVRPKVAI